MSQIVADPNTLALFQQAKQTLELVDPTGRILGHFVPAMNVASKLEPQISDEEINRRIRQGGGRSLAAILADLEKRA